MLRTNQRLRGTKRLIFIRLRQSSDTIQQHAIPIWCPYRQQFARTCERVGNYYTLNALSMEYDFLP